MRCHVVTTVVLRVAVSVAAVSGAALSSAVSGAAAAQDHAAVQDPVFVFAGQAHGAPMLPPMIDYKIGMMAVEPLALAEPVPNAPYSAEIVTEIIQELADGNRIERRSSSTVARDSRGRVRREQQIAAIGPMLPEGDVRMVTISDPVERVHYALDPGRKTVMRSRPPLPPGGGAWAAREGPVREGPALAPVAVTGGGRVAVAVGAPDAGPHDVMTFTRQVESSDTGDVRTEKLGSKQIEGVRAEGTRVVSTLPAGAIGNLRPIEVVNERWYSPELRIVVYSRRADPRFGETIYRLTNLVRAEPDPSLFQVPADYKQEEIKPPVLAPKPGVRVKPPL